MTEPKAPKIEFPCDYAIRVMGDAAPDFRELVVSIMELHAGPVDAARVTVRDSRNGRFMSVTVAIVATGEPQLQAIFDALKATGRVHMVL